MRSKGSDYFVDSVRATHANRDHCIANPRGWKGYGALVWGSHRVHGRMAGRHPGERDGPWRSVSRARDRGASEAAENLAGRSLLDAVSAGRKPRSP
jgi:hypothetical protein